MLRHHDRRRDSLGREGKTAPDVDEVHTLADSLRIDQIREAKEARQTLGRTSSRSTPFERVLLEASHDVENPHHDKCTKSHAVFPSRKWAHLSMNIMRVSFAGQLSLGRYRGLKLKSVPRGQPGPNRR